MGKEFVEHRSENGKIPYSASTLCFCLTQYAKEYIVSNRKLISNIDVKVRDAVLVDAINYLGMQGGIDFALYTKGLYDNRVEEDYVDPQCILTVIPNHFAYYIFNYGIVKSVLENNHMNDCTKKFDVNDGVLVLLDFINYISKRNGYDRTFTINDLYQKAQKQSHNQRLNELKSFLEFTGIYTERLQNGEDIDLIFNEMAKEYGLKYVSKRGKYYYTDEIKKRTGSSEMYSWDRHDVEKRLYAMAYAYEKLQLDNKKEPQTEIIKIKIKEMKRK